MILINTDKKEYISGTYGKEKFSIPYDAETYDKLKEIAAESKKVKNLEELQPLLDTVASLVEVDLTKSVTSGIGGIKFVPASGKYHIEVGTGYSDVHIPDKIMDTMLDNMERDIENTPLINLCRRFLFNPKPTQKRFDMLANYITQTFTDKEEVKRIMEDQGVTREVAEKFATYKDMQVTEEGYLKTSKVVEELTMKYTVKLDDSGKPVLDEIGKPVIIQVPRWKTAYKVNEETGEVTEEQEKPNYLEERRFTPAIYKGGDKFFSGDELGYKYVVGELARLESWDQVSMIDEQAHEKGLHTGGLSYIENWLREGRELLDVFVCPSQIGKFVNNGCGEMTCKEMFVHGAATIEGTTQGLYHSSSYAAIQTDEMFKRLEEKVNEIREANKIKEQDAIDMREIAKTLKNE